MILLDTDHMSLLERREDVSLPLRRRLSACPPDDVAVSIISYEEQTRGWLSYIAQAKSPDGQIEAYRRLKLQHRNYCSLTVLDFDSSAMNVFQQLLKLRLKVGTMDLKIAAIALANDALLLTRNSSDFSRVPGLRIEDWTI